MYELIEVFGDAKVPAHQGIPDHNSYFLVRSCDFELKSHSKQRYMHYRHQARRLQSLEQTSFVGSAVVLCTKEIDLDSDAVAQLLDVRLRKEWADSDADLEIVDRTSNSVIRLQLVGGEEHVLAGASRLLGDLVEVGEWWYRHEQIAIEGLPSQQDSRAKASALSLEVPKTVVRAKKAPS